MTVPIPTDWFKFNAYIDEGSLYRWVNEISHASNRDVISYVTSTLATGYFGNCIQHDAGGESAWIQNAGPGTDFDWGTNSFSIYTMFYLRADGPSYQTNSLFARADSAGDYIIKAYINKSTGFLTVSFQDNLLAETTLSVPDIDWRTRPYEWHSLAITRSGQTYKLYLDCTLVAETLTGPVTLNSPSATNFYIGAGGYLNTWSVLFGRIDSFSHWLGTTLTNEQIQEFYNREVNVDAPVVENQNPAPGAIDVEINDDIYIEVYDATQGIDTSSLVLNYHNGATWTEIYASSVWASGWGGSVTIDPIDGVKRYNILINTHPNFPVLTTIGFRVRVDDLGSPVLSVDETYYVTTVIANTTQLVPVDPVEQGTLGIRGTISFNLTETTHTVTAASIVIYLDNVPVYASEVFAAGYSGTITSDGSGGYACEVASSSEWEYNDAITVRVTATNNVSGTLDDYYLVVVEPVPEVEGLVYNIYYRPAHTKPWTLANLVPITHSEILNRYTITGLGENGVYHVAVVPGIIINEEFIPLIQQTVPNDDQEVGDINFVEGYPFVTVKTFSP